MYNTLKKMYNEGKINIDGLQKAVQKGWITQEQLEQIISENSVQNVESDVNV